MGPIVFLLPALLLCGGVACTSGAAQPRAENPTPRRTDRITREEIAERNWASIYDMIATLRPLWLSERGRDSFGSGAAIQVVMNGQRLGGVAALRRITPGEVEHVQHYDAASATSRWGMGFSKGAIEVSTTPQR